MTFLRAIIVLVFILIAGAEIWMWNYHSARDVSNFTPIQNGSVIVNGGEETAEYEELRSIGIVATNILNEKGIKGAVSKQDLAKMVLSDPQYLFPPGVKFRIDGAGDLVVTQRNRKYQVYSDGARVTVDYAPYGRPDYFPY